MHISVDTIILYPLINVSEYPSMAISYPSMTISYPSTDYSSNDKYGVFKHVTNNLNTTF